MFHTILFAWFAAFSSLAQAGPVEDLIEVLRGRNFERIEKYLETAEKWDLSAIKKQTSVQAFKNLKKELAGTIEYLLVEQRKLFDSDVSPDGDLALRFDDAIGTGFAVALNLRLASGAIAKLAAFSIGKTYQNQAKQEYPNAEKYVRAYLPKRGGAFYPALKSADGELRLALARALIVYTDDADKIDIMIALVPLIGAKDPSGSPIPLNWSAFAGSVGTKGQFLADSFLRYLETAPDTDFKDEFPFLFSSVGDLGVKNEKIISRLQVLLEKYKKLTSNFDAEDVRIYDELIQYFKTGVSVDQRKILNAHANGLKARHPKNPGRNRNRNRSRVDSPFPTEIYVRMLLQLDADDRELYIVDMVRHVDFETTREVLRSLRSKNEAIYFELQNISECEGLIEHL